MDKETKKKKPSSTKKTNTSKKTSNVKANNSKRKVHSKPIAKKSAASELKKEAIEVKFEETRVETKMKTLQFAIVLVATFVLLLLLANRTFFRTTYSQKFDDKEINIEIPRFSYFISDKANEITLKTLRKSENTLSYYNRYLESESFDLYDCSNVNGPAYYNRQYGYFLYDVNVEKAFVIKTVTMNYALDTVDDFCQ